MKIWVDADACPKAIKEILFRAAEKRQISLTLVANKPLRTPASAYIKTILVPSGFDVADNAIAQSVSQGDLVVTADIPLASLVVDKGAQAIDPRGELYTRDNIQERLSIRNFMDGLRSGGIETGGPSSFRHKDRLAFANQLDRFLTKRQ